MTSIKQLVSSIGLKSFSCSRRSFENIVGHDDIKLIFDRAIHSKRPVHVLLVGKPGSAKTLFLTTVKQTMKDSYFMVGSNTTKAGLVNQLFEKRPKFLLIDELDKMNKVDQTSLLHLMETGIVSETKIKKTRQTVLTSWIFATANSSEEITEPLLSRFLILQIPEYTFEEFTEISVSRLQKENVNKQVATCIAEKVWSEIGSRNIRDVIKVGRLASNIEDVPFIINMMKPQQNSQENLRYAR